MKTTLSLESQHDSVGSKGSQNHIFLVFFEVLNLSALSRPAFFDVFGFLVILGFPLGPVLATFCLRKMIQNFNGKSGPGGVSKPGVGGMRACALGRW